MAMKCCTKLETAKERCPIVFQGHPSNFKVTRDKTSPDPNWVFPDYRPVAAFKSLRFALLCSECDRWGQNKKYTGRPVLQLLPYKCSPLPVTLIVFSNVSQLIEWANPNHAIFITQHFFGCDQAALNSPIKRCKCHRHPSVRLFVTPFSQCSCYRTIMKFSGVIIPFPSCWFHVVRPSVCPSVDKIVSPLYLPQYYLDPFHICTSHQATSEGCHV